MSKKIFVCTAALLRHLAVMCILCCIGLVEARDVATYSTAIAAEELPTEARITLRLIRDGGPFPYRRDGVEFQNRENRLPRRPRGYYHEFTVKTPGAYDRGARRIITGNAEEYYYTQDHYRSFQRITP